MVCASRVCTVIRRIALVAAVVAGVWLALNIAAMVAAYEGEN